MNIRDTLDALVCFLRNGNKSGNTTAAIHGVAHVGPAPGKDWESPRLACLYEEEAQRMMREFKVPCIPLADPIRVRAARPGPVVFDAWTVEQLARKALQRIQELEQDLGDAIVERDLLRAELARLRSAPPATSSLDSSDEACKCRILRAAYRTGYVDFDEEDVSEADIEIVRELIRDIREDVRPAPVAVEVPMMSERESELELSAFMEDFTGSRAEAYTKGMYYGIHWVRERIQPIDPSRILKDGEREELEILRKIADEWCPPFGVPQMPRTKKLFAQLKALRSSREGAE